MKMPTLQGDGAITVLLCRGSTMLTAAERTGSCQLWRMVLTAWAFKGDK